MSRGEIVKKMKKHPCKKEKACVKSEKSLEKPH